MSDFMGSIWGKCKEGRVGETKKRQFMALAIIFMLGVRLFFSVFLENQNVFADVAKTGKLKNLAEIDPMEKIGKGFLTNKCQNSSFCQSFRVEEIIPDTEEEYMGLVDGYPIEKMLPEIAKEDKKTADFIIAIAKKESDWGKHSPSTNGEDCYNYWGYKGREEKQVLGYSCFSSREEAIEKVGTRINNLIEKGIDTPEKMLVWKCGSSCSGHNPQDVRKWVADVEHVLRSIKT